VAIQPVQVAPIWKRVKQLKKHQLKNQPAAVAEAKTNSAVSTIKNINRVLVKDARMASGSGFLM
jgi:hypothetical protein